MGLLRAAHSECPMLFIHILYRRCCCTCNCTQGHILSMHRHFPVSVQFLAKKTKTLANLIAINLRHNGLPLN